MKNLTESLNRVSISFQALVSIKRIQKFLNMEELDPKAVERTDASGIDQGNIDLCFASPAFF